MVLGAVQLRGRLKSQRGPCKSQNLLRQSSKMLPVVLNHSRQSPSVKDVSLMSEAVDRDNAAGSIRARLLREADAARVLVIDKEALGAEAGVIGIVALRAKVGRVAQEE